MATNRNRIRDDDVIADSQRSRGVTINWAALGVVGTLFLSMVSFVWLAATQNAAITANHNTETAAIATSNAAITQLQSDQKDNSKQMVEVLLHLSSMDQTLKTILTYGVPRAGLVPQSSGGNTIIQQAPAAEVPVIK